MTDKFEVIAADITNNCNLRCTFCFNDFTGAKNQFITDEMFEKVISLLERIPRELRQKVFFTTNLTTKITDDTLDRLSNVGIHHIK